MSKMLERVGDLRRRCDREGVVGVDLPFRPHQTTFHRGSGGPNDTMLAATMHVSQTSCIAATSLTA